jgi:hypothetical protein
VRISLRYRPFSACSAGMLKSRPARVGPRKARCGSPIPDIDACTSALRCVLTQFVIVPADLLDSPAGSARTAVEESIVDDRVQDRRRQATTNHGFRDRHRVGQPSKDYQRYWGHANVTWAMLICHQASNLQISMAPFAEN